MAESKGTVLHSVGREECVAGKVGMILEGVAMEKLVVTVSMLALNLVILNNIQVISIIL